MSKFKVINLIDKIFVSCCVFLAIFAWINFYIRNLWATFVLSLIFSFAVVFLLYYFLNKKTEKTNINKKQLEQMNKILLAFRLASKKEQIEIIKSALEKQHETKQENNKLTYVDALGKHLVILALDLQKFTENDLLNILNKHYSKSINCYDIFCNEHTNINCNLLKNAKINLISNKNLYENYILNSEKELDCEFLNSSSSKLTFKDILNTFFLPSKAKSYFLCGLILIFSSIILPYYFYYIVVGSTLLLFAIICKLLPKFKNNS